MLKKCWPGRNQNLNSISQSGVASFYFVPPLELVPSQLPFFFCHTAFLVIFSMGSIEKIFLQTDPRQNKQPSLGESVIIIFTNRSLASRIWIFLRSHQIWSSHSGEGDEQSRSVCPNADCCEGDAVRAAPPRQQRSLTSSQISPAEEFFFLQNCTTAFSTSPSNHLHLQI